jgi:hypothetical protein
VMHVYKGWKVRPIAAWTGRTADAEPGAQEEAEPIINRELFFFSSNEINRAAIIISQRAIPSEDCEQRVISIISYSPKLHRLEKLSHYVTSGSLAMARVVAGSSLTTLNIYIANDDYVGIAHVGQLKALRILFVRIDGRELIETEVDWTGLPGWQLESLHTLLYSCSEFSPEQETSFLARCRFPALQTISLSGLPDTQALADIIAEFFSRYPLLQDVEIRAASFSLKRILPFVQASRLMLFGNNHRSGELIAHCLSPSVHGLILGSYFFTSEDIRVLWEQVDAFETLSKPPSLHWLSLWFTHQRFSRTDLSGQGRSPHDERFSTEILRCAELLAKKGIVLVDQDGLPLHPASSNLVIANPRPLRFNERAQRGILSSVR